MSKELKRSLARLHVNMGHSPKEELIRILAASGSLSSRALAGLDALRCGSCIRMTVPKKPPVSSTTSKAASQFGDRLQADIVFIRTLSQNVAVLGIVDEFTNYTVAATLKDRHPPNVLEQVLNMWYRPLGLPHHITVDPDTAFLGAMEDWHHRYGIEYDIIPAEEHWRIGKVERRNALLRTLVERLVDHHGITTKEALDEALIAASFALNSSTYSFGRSPFQAVFGRVPRPLGDLLSDESAMTLSMDKNEYKLKPELLRAEAITTLMQVTASQAVRRGLLRKTRNQQELSHLQPGQTVAFWRWQGRSRQHKKGSWSLGRFLAFDPDKKSCWIQVGKTSIRIGNNQIRLATGWENWTPSEEDVRLLKDAEANFAQGLWDDQRGDGPGDEEMATADQEILDFRPIQEPRLHALPPDAAAAEATEAQLALPAPPQAPTDAQGLPLDLATIPRAITSATPHPVPLQQHAEQTITTSIQQQPTNQQQNQANTYIDQRRYMVHVDSPTYQQYGSATGFGAVPPTPRSRHRSRTPSRAHIPTRAPETPGIEWNQEQRPAQTPELEDTPTPALADNTTPVLPDTSTAEQAEGPAAMDEPLPVLPMKRPADTLATLQLNDDGSITQRPMHWDGSPDPVLPYASHHTYYQAYLNSDRRQIEMKGMPDPARPDHDSSGDEDLSISNDRTLTRQEMKQLDRELPWREIMAMDEDTIQSFVKSAVNEHDGWMSWAGVRSLSPAEAKNVFQDPKLRRRIMKARAAYKDKARGVPPLKAKTRVVIIGCGDPDLRQLTRDAPTPTRLSEFIILSIAAAGANKEFNNDGQQWTLWISDAEKAFLQGQQDKSERSGPIYMMPPQDPIIKRAQVFTSPLYEITGNCYGLCNAPRTWYLKVNHDLLEASFIRHSFDKCFYYHLNEQQQLDCALIVHVDDFLAVYAQQFNEGILHDLFKWGSITKVTPTCPGEYRGKEIIMEEKNGRYSYLISQKAFTDAMDEGVLPKGRLQGPAALSESELKDFRSLIGSLQWLSGQTRPDLAAPASLRQKGTKTSIEDLAMVYQYVKYARSTSGQGIRVPPVPFNRSSVLLAYGDSSWCNAVD